MAGIEFSFISSQSDLDRRLRKKAWNKTSNAAQQLLASASHSRSESEENPRLKLKWNGRYQAQIIYDIWILYNIVEMSKFLLLFIACTI